jgi:arginine N-succinyltransferase
MLLIRPLADRDLDALYAMAEKAGKGLTSLPADRGLLQQKIDLAGNSFSQRCAPEAALYLFALEDTATGQAVGISGIQARVGRDEVFYNYRLSVTVNASRELGVHVRTPTLQLSNDMTDVSEICSLLLADTYKGGGNGLLLSRCRFLFLDDFREQFSEKIFAEMRGVSDAEGNNPLWDALGSKFFDMAFSEADRLSGMGNKSFIAELMPKYPIYLSMLPSSARSVIGCVHANTAPALNMLQAEGFNFNGLVDIFDGGPVVETFIDNIRTVRETVGRTVTITDTPVAADVPVTERVIVANRSMRHFRATTLPLTCVNADTIELPQDVAAALQVQAGDTVRLAPLKDSGPLPRQSFKAPQ